MSKTFKDQKFEVIMVHKDGNYRNKCKKFREKMRRPRPSLSEIYETALDQFFGEGEEK